MSHIPPIISVPLGSASQLLRDLANRVFASSSSDKDQSDSTWGNLGYTRMKRIIKDYEDLLANPLDSVEIRIIDESDFTEWELEIDGPSGSPYEGGLFKAELKFPCSYPMQPPKIRFKTLILHPNVDEAGVLAIDEPSWLPTTSLATVIQSILALISSPSLAESDVCLKTPHNQLAVDNPPLYEHYVRSWTKKFATRETSPRSDAHPETEEGPSSSASTSDLASSGVEIAVEDGSMKGDEGSSSKQQQQEDISDARYRFGQMNQKAASSD